MVSFHILLGLKTLLGILKLIPMYNGDKDGQADLGFAGSLIPLPRFL